MLQVLSPGGALGQRAGNGMVMIDYYMDKLNWPIGCRDAQDRLYRCID